MRALTRLILVVVQKPTQHCKATILQFKKNTQHMSWIGTVCGLPGLWSLLGSDGKIIKLQVDSDWHSFQTR